jgi:hypothetical protein
MITSGTSLSNSMSSDDLTSGITRRMPWKDG